MAQNKNDGRKDNEFNQGGMSEKEKEEARKKSGEHSSSGGRPKGS